MSLELFKKSWSLCVHIPLLQPCNGRWWGLQFSWGEGGCAAHLRLPLEAKGVSFPSLQDEVEVVDYARTYLNICQVECRKVWYTLSWCSKNGPTSTFFVNWHSVCHSPMEEWSRFSPPWRLWRPAAERTCKWYTEWSSGDLRWRSSLKLLLSYQTMVAWLHHVKTKSAT